MNNQLKIWTCSNCGVESTINCKTCDAQLTERDRSLKKCGTCGSPVDKPLFDCAHCDSSSTLNIIEGILNNPRKQLWIRRSFKLLRLIVGTSQMIGLITIAISCSISGGEGTISNSGPSTEQMQLFGFGTFFGLIPLQIYLLKRITALE